MNIKAKLLKESRREKRLQELSYQESMHKDPRIR